MKQYGVVLLVLLLSAWANAASKPLVNGPHGKVFDAKKASLAISGRREYATPPLTIECWARLDSKEKFNILVAQNPKAFPAHWELYSYAGSGVLSAYLPGCEPSEIKSDRVVTDGQWHYLAMQFETNRVRLYVDGKLETDQPVHRRSSIRDEGTDLRIGMIPGEPSLKCDGLIGPVRISQGLRAIENNASPERLTADESTIGLWRMEKILVRQIDDESAFRNPAHVQMDPAAEQLGISMDEVDRKSFAARPGPIQTKVEQVSLKKGAAPYSKTDSGPTVLSLDGDWQLAEDTSEIQRSSNSWPDAITAQVPGSIHTALFTAGKIPDPKFGTNDTIAHEQSFKTWWYRRSFPKPIGEPPYKLVFDGVAIHCTVWLNGKLLGSHEGMFGGPEFDVSGLVQDQNELVVKIDPAPGDPKLWNNPDWRKTVVFNCVWGWHYSSIPALGIWRSVRIESVPEVSLIHPFVVTRDAQRGIVDLTAEIRSASTNWSGTLSGTFKPENFEGSSYGFSRTFKRRGSNEVVHLRFNIPQPQLWWPNNIGQPNLYRLNLSLTPEAGRGDCKTINFGLRTVEMAPLPGGPRSTQYNWTFLINKRPMFVKGSGWCTMDSSMDFSRERYDRLLTLAQMQHIQMLRCWGSGMPETDDFYELCDRKGIMVLQEWPTAWDSHTVQPYDVLEETVRLNTLRLRNHPSLVMYGGGNESGNPVGKAIDMMGRLAIELDGTRPFHRAEPWGGSVHNYNCYWGREPLDHNLNMTAPFWGEFGLACMPVYESVMRYLPEAEKNIWPPRPEGSLIHHTPIFGTAQDWDRLSQYSDCFVAPSDLRTFISGSQLSQVVGVRHTLERARTRWPECTGALYYKMNDNYPAASWSCVDWYGAPKMGHYFFQDAFAPLHACVIFNSVSNQARTVEWPVFLLDDTAALYGKAWQVSVRAFDSSLKEIKKTDYLGKGATATPRQLGSFTLTSNQTDTTPLFVVAEVRTNQVLATRTFYFVNYERSKGSLFTLPRTQLAHEVRSNLVSVSNRGRVPAVSVAVLRPGHLDTFTANDNYFWLDPGETRSVTVSSADGLEIEAWNLDSNR